MTNFPISQTSDGATFANNISATASHDGVAAAFRPWHHFGQPGGAKIGDNLQDFNQLVSTSDNSKEVEKESVFGFTGYKVNAESLWLAARLNLRSRSRNSRLALSLVVLRTSDNADEVEQEWWQCAACEHQRRDGSLGRDEVNDLPNRCLLTKGSTHNGISWSVSISSSSRIKMAINYNAPNHLKIMFTGWCGGLRGVALSGVVLETI
ncbi:hypothetical protein V8F06_010561 [Rhypophila decipiens]